MQRWAIIGATASGKSDVAIHAARRTSAEIVSVDSMQIYRGMDVGAAKPSPDQQAEIPHHMIDVADPPDYWSAGRFAEEANKALADCDRRGVRALVVGGAALYLKALIHGIFDAPGADPEYRSHLEQVAAEKGVEELHGMLRQVDPASASRLHPNDTKRVVRALEVHHLTGRPMADQQTQFDRPVDSRLWRIFGLKWPRDVLYSRINARVDAMIDAGLEEEARRLLARYGDLGPQASQALGYKEMADCAAGRCPFDETVRLIKRNTRRFARRQLQWFAKFDSVEWIDMAALERSAASADQLSEMAAERILESVGGD